MPLSIPNKIFQFWNLQLATIPHKLFGNTFVCNLLIFYSVMIRREKFKRKKKAGEIKNIEKYIFYTLYILQKLFNTCTETLDQLNTIGLVVFNFL